MDQRYSFFLREMSFSLPIPSIPSACHRQVSFLPLSLAVDECYVRDHSALLGGGVTLHAPEAQLHQPTWLTHCPSTLLSTSSGQSG